MEKTDKIYVAGHRGLVGSALMRALEAKGYSNLVYRELEQLDLTRQEEVEKFFEEEKPEVVLLAAAKVGGIQANNTYPAQFIYENLMIASNVIHASYLNKVNKLLFLGSSCIYPKASSQPIQEDYLLTGSLEPTNEAYAIAKICGIELCKFYRRQYGCHFIAAMPTNLYGIGDNFNLETSHVLPALLRKFHEAKLRGDKEVVMWGSGKPRREFLYVEDLADACLHLLNHYDEESPINIGTGEDIEIGDLAQRIKRIVGYEGEILQDLTKPDGTMRKQLNVERLHESGWKHQVGLEEGIATVYKWYVDNYKG